MSQLQGLKVSDFEQQKKRKNWRNQLTTKNGNVVDIRGSLRDLVSKNNKCRGTPNLDNNNNVSILIQNNTY